MSGVALHHYSGSRKYRCRRCLRRFSWPPPEQPEGTPARVYRCAGCLGGQRKVSEEQRALREAFDGVVARQESLAQEAWDDEA